MQSDQGLHSLLTEPLTFEEDNSFRSVFDPL